MSKVTLQDKYTQTTGRVYLTGSQALVRIPIMQRRRDEEAGLNTAGFISGYRGSPLGIYDLALWQASDQLRDAHVQFQPGVNEDLAATSVWGSQQIDFVGKAKYDGVFAMWYGKGPGVDRSGDPIKHGNYAGAAKNGGVLVLCGDDHAARSSTVAHQSDHALIHFGVPILHPATIQDYLDYGIYGFAMSRFSGAWVGFKCVTDTIETSASVDVDPARITIRTPEDYKAPADGLNIRPGVWPVVQEQRLFEQRLLAVQAFVRANALDGIRVGKAGRKRLGIVSTGKSYLDVLEALRRLGIDQARAEALGIAVYKCALVWPLEPQNITAFARDCDELMVVEEKRPVIEEQLAHILYHLPEGERPVLTGKRDDMGAPLLSSVGELSPDVILRAVGKRMPADEGVAGRLAALSAPVQAGPGPAAGQGALMRMPSFCAGCPHNSSTKVPEGSKAVSGIGCHGLAVFLPERNTMFSYHMGGEGAGWIGQAPFVEMPHIFQNLGDGTYFHSGLLAVRACVAANVNITYKILLNGAVGMTGGQPIEGEQFDGGVTTPHVAAQLDAEGVRRIAVVSDDPSRHDPADFPKGITFHHRDELDAVQKELREWKGVSALVYDQACATERRRLRKRGKVADPAKRMFINQEVCEGCGDCGVQSNCIALEPVQTPLGRKRRINQSVCNKDFSCVKGLCPSFVTVLGGTPRKAAASAAQDDTALAATLPMPVLPTPSQDYNILIAGIGGNGVVTIGAILGMAAHIDGKPATVLDISGLAQRNGAVTSHVRFAAPDGAEHASRIPQGAIDLLVGCDLVVATGAEVLSKLSADRSAAVFNRFIAPTSTFASNPDLKFDDAPLRQLVDANTRPDSATGVNATSIGIKMLGEALGANMFLLGLAWQKGYLPLSLDSLQQAITLNGAAVALNRRAFAMGRIAAVYPEKIAEWMPSADADAQPAVESLDDLIADRVARLTAYQNADYAARFLRTVEQVRAADRAFGRDEALTRAVVRTLSKLMAYKDEYEVGRLYSDESFMHAVNDAFEGNFSLRFNLAPPLWARRDADGRPRKMEFGPWVMIGFRMLARLKRLRGTALDPFGYMAHRKLERALIGEYEALLQDLLSGLDGDRYDRAVELAALYDGARGYDLIKEENIERLRAEREGLLAAYHAGPASAARVPEMA
ncbi:indolepyruvate ferredoxin oxidoreductase family protein [Sphingomonas sp. C3-2]|uniref:indolepyruvate ferredoxin oxidoreductase family protein n=1 Tax=Sphingomonas sp. C3-2 TaxID=3062169 RepID=UPI00294B1309|nr:indolepyruvate ferredoxin oxidoreductase family protein [Sphingomonas sp. C3-2]WOK36712.1 indolepyruvate ferredoxin oxidoreductase family protein [Sphingomonas sp. C3-2]